MTPEPQEPKYDNLRVGKVAGDKLRDVVEVIRANTGIGPTQTEALVIIVNFYLDHVGKFQPA